MRRTKGFTLIELLIVIAVLGALAAVIVPNVGSFLGSANRAAANTEVQNVKTGSMSYLADNGAMPVDSDALRGTTDYISEAPKAKYTFDTDSTTITQVDSVTDGWSTTSLVFAISEQQWIAGTDDGAGGTQDID